jgi:hypothetical protein
VKILMTIACGFAFAANAAAGSIYTCTDAQGKPHTADRPIRECEDREQIEKNPDGSTRRIVPRAQTDDERAAATERERVQAADRAAEKTKARTEGNLLRRYPNEEVHERSRRAALDSVRASMRANAARLRELQQERKQLADEEAFYPARPLPAKLRSAIDANEAAQAAQHQTEAANRAELARVSAVYDAELATLRRLWATQ